MTDQKAIQTLQVATEMMLREVGVQRKMLGNQKANKPRHFMWFHRNKHHRY